LMFFILALFSLCLVYLVGYGTGHKSVVRDETKFGIISYLNLYQLAEAGNTNELQYKLRFLVYSASDYYDRYFSNEVVTNQSFLKRLAEARIVASTERTQVVTFNANDIMRQLNAELRTNGQSNAAISEIRLEKSP
jgi:hypothetical protein